MEDEQPFGRFCTPYYHPEKCNLEIVEATHKPDLSYEFDMVILWKEKTTGEMYWGRDSGCSCPKPFEWVKGLHDLNDYKFTKAEYELAKAECAKSRQRYSWEEEEKEGA